MTIRSEVLTAASKYHKLVHRDSNKVVNEGNKARMMAEMKRLNKLNPKSHFLGYSVNKKVGDSWSEETASELDALTMDVPLFIRMLEFAKEDAKDDMQLHTATENALRIQRENSVPVLGMVNYDEIVSVAEAQEIVSGVDASKEVTPPKLVLRPGMYKVAYALMRIVGRQVDSPGTNSLFFLFTTQIAQLAYAYSDDSKKLNEAINVKREEVKKNKVGYLTLIRLLDKMAAGM